MRSITLGVAVMLALLGAGCSRGQGKPPAEGTIFTVVVSKDAASAANQDGVDLEHLVARSAEKVFSLLPHRGRVRIHVGLDATQAIPEIGIGGFTDPRTGDVSLWIDANPPRGLRKALETWMPGSVAHELHHSSRIRTGPGYGVTLAKALVSEGLADHFATEAFPETPAQPWDHALTSSQERSLWLDARRILNVPFGYDHPSWFFGAGNMPRWAGYTLGYEMVGRYLDHRRSASDAVAVDATDVIESFRGP